MDQKLVVGGGNDAAETLFLLEQRRFQIDQFGFQHCFDFRFQTIEFGFIVGENGNVKADVKNFLGRLLEGVAQIFQVLISGVQFRVAHHTLFFPQVNLALDFGDFFLELAQNTRSFHRMNKNGNIKNFVQIEDRCEPAFGQVARIGNDEESPNQFFAQVNFFRVNLKGRRGDDVPQFQNAGLVNFLRQNRRNRQSIFFEDIKKSHLFKKFQVPNHKLPTNFNI